MNLKKWLLLSLSLLIMVSCGPKDIYNFTRSIIKAGVGARSSASFNPVVEIPDTCDGYCSIDFTLPENTHSVFYSIEWASNESTDTTSIKPTFPTGQQYQSTYGALSDGYSYDPMKMLELRKKKSTKNDANGNPKTTTEWTTNYYWLNWNDAGVYANGNKNEYQTDATALFDKATNKGTLPLDFDNTVLDKKRSWSKKGNTYGKYLVSVVVISDKGQRVCGNQPDSRYQYGSSQTNSVSGVASWCSSLTSRGVSSDSNHLANALSRLSFDENGVHKSNGIYYVRKWVDYKPCTITDDQGKERRAKYSEASATCKTNLLRHTRLKNKVYTKRNESRRSGCDEKTLEKKKYDQKSSVADLLRCSGVYTGLSKELFYALPEKERWPYPIKASNKTLDTLIADLHTFMRTKMDRDFARSRAKSKQKQSTYATYFLQKGDRYWQASSGASFNTREARKINFIYAPAIKTALQHHDKQFEAALSKDLTSLSQNERESLVEKAKKRVYLYQTARFLQDAKYESILSLAQGNSLDQAQALRRIQKHKKDFDSLDSVGLSVQDFYSESAFSIIKSHFESTYNDLSSKLSGKPSTIALKELHDFYSLSHPVTAADSIKRLITDNYLQTKGTEYERKAFQTKFGNTYSRLLFASAAQNPLWLFPKSDVVKNESGSLEFASVPEEWSSQYGNAKYNELCATGWEQYLSYVNDLNATELSKKRVSAKEYEHSVKMAGIKILQFCAAQKIGSNGFGSKGNFKPLSSVLPQSSSKLAKPVLTTQKSSVKQRISTELKSNNYSKIFDMIDSNEQYFGSKWSKPLRKTYKAKEKSFKAKEKAKRDKAKARAAASKKKRNKCLKEKGWPCQQRCKVKNRGNRGGLDLGYKTCIQRCCAKCGWSGDMYKQCPIY